MEAEDLGLRRPLIPYTCSNLNIESNDLNNVKNNNEKGCGLGTKRPPFKTC